MKMLTKQTIAGTNIVEVNLDGAVEESDVEDLRAEIDRVISEHGKFKILVLLGDLGNVGPRAIWEDLKLETSVLSDLERAAVVTDKEWFERMVEGLDPLFSARMEHFEPGEREAALRWLVG
jgi:hypothetical protein